MDESVAGKTALGPLATRYGERLGLFYAALFLIYGVHLPYLAVWLDGRGLTASQIGIITAAPFFIRLVVTPALCLVADRFTAHRQAIVLLSWSALAASLVLSQLSGFWSILLVAVTFHLASSTIMPLTETLAVAGVKRRGLNYGHMRLWGSLSFIAATAAGGALVGVYGSSTGVWLMAVGAAATALAAHLLPADRLGAAVSQPNTAASVAEARRLVRNGTFLVFLLAVGAVQGAHAMFYTFGALHWSNQGIPGHWIGILWGIGVLAEVLLFAYSGRVLARFNAPLLLIIGSAAALLRWTVMAVDPPFAALFPLQILHALTYGATHIAAIHFIGRAVPEGASGTAQSLYATVAAGIAMGAATLAAGHLYASQGATGYLAMTAMSAVGLVASLVLARRWHGAVLWTIPASTPEAR